MRHLHLAVIMILLSLATPALALDGQIGTHDPSTVVECEGKFYRYATGNLTPMVSDDGWTWKRGAVSPLAEFGGRIPETVRSLSPANRGTQVWAPDVVKIGETYYLYYAVSAWMDYRSVVGLMTSPTLDPQSPKYKWTDCGPIVWSDGKDGMNAIDPGVMYDPSTKSRWMVYGSYHGTIQLVELDPHTGLRKNKNVPTITVASQSEAADLMYHDGWYYLLTNHGSCCQECYHQAAR
jgi:arabinan endo-1,5-alpha-L-arabinosidase